MFNSETVKPYLGLAVRFSFYWVPALIFIVLGLALVKPLMSKNGNLSQKINERSSYITTVKRSEFDIKKTKAELEEFKLKVKEFDKRLPEIQETKLNIETLQEVTKDTKLKFSSLKPASIIKHELKETKEVFVELPIDVKLSCGYYELIDYLKKIETADQLMKISSLSIKSNSGNSWEHMVEFSVSAFSKGEIDVPAKK